MAVVGGGYGSFTWSPCGQFIATHAGRFGDFVEIRDGLTLGLLSTLTAPDGCLIDEATSSSNGHSPTSTTEKFPSTIPNAYLTGGPTYSPDGCSLASLSSTSLIIWDVQTGGVTKQIECSSGRSVSLVWSLDGGMVGSIFCNEDSEIWTVHICDIASGTTLSSTMLLSTDKPHLWAHNTSFQVMTTGWDGQALTVNIFEVGSTLTMIESFQINLWATDGWARQYRKKRSYEIKSFSPTTYNISIRLPETFAILDIRSSKCLLEQEGTFSSDSFSQNGSLFAVYSTSLHIWKHTPGCYTMWRKFPFQKQHSYTAHSLHFSPSLSSVLSGFKRGNALQVWRLDGVPQVQSLDDSLMLAAPHCCTTYVVTCHKWDSTIIITNLLSQTIPHFIDTGMKIEMICLIGNIVLAVGSATITAWKLTEEGAVCGNFGNAGAGYSDRIWTIPRSKHQKFLVENQTMFIQEEVTIMHIYHTETGEALEPTQAGSPSCWGFQYIYDFIIYLPQPDKNGHSSCSASPWSCLVDAAQRGWIKGPERKHQLWMPIRWRSWSNYRVYWLYKTKTLWFKTNDQPVVIQF
jgi:hypothetical protein